MRKKQLIISGLLVIGLLIFLLSSCTTKKPKSELTQTEELVTFVNKAVELIEKEGEDCFPEFRKKDSKWFHNDLYIFVWGLDGMRYVYPPNLDGEGENMLDLKDINGKPIGRLIVDAASGKKGEGWVHYQWPKPEKKEPSWKSTFVKRVTAPSGKTYLVGSGLYDLKIDKSFIVEEVNDVIVLIKKVGITSLDTIRAKSSEFIFLDTYVFVKDIKGNELVNPAFPELEGQNLYDLQDSNGKYFIREELEILKTKDDCWMDYMWPKPGETEPSKKLVYVKKVVVGQDTLVVGAGYFTE
ncbi:MAG: cache domain-containing protein [Candidatus Cloacimonetes bacterium]|nr:cache domain-containing protein [Candidatus Cloacimonadota bacterium]MBL7085488.1 cache domain-containing protein [Candidatus Cloacimonadota bacterium]